MREATSQDRAGLLAFLRQREPQSIFPLVNLSSLSGVRMRAWMAADQGGIVGMVGLTDAGFLMPQWPGGDWARVKQTLQGQRMVGMTGPMDQIKALKTAFGLKPADLRLDQHEPGFTLTLTDIRLPKPDGSHLAALGDADLDEITDWRVAFNAETFGQIDEGAHEKAAAEVQSWLPRGSHKVLWHNGKRVALTGFNARLPEVVQIGGVFVPPQLRKQGYARQAVAQHLVEARAEGVKRAVLFAASPAAEHAYRALNFQPAGRKSIVLFNQPKVL
ncbi:MAG: GNAT family N-acetyltransferase [Paracoccaceae bacterium]